MRKGGGSKAFTNIIPSVAYTCDRLLGIWKPRVKVRGCEAEGVFLSLRYYEGNISHFEENGIVATCWGGHSAVRSIAICTVCRSTCEAFIYFPLFAGRF
jgi:hypothetical protein